MTTLCLSSFTKFPHPLRPPALSFKSYLNPTTFPHQKATFGRHPRLGVLTKRARPYPPLCLSKTDNTEKRDKRDSEEDPLVRSDFPSDFLFGASTSALQIESYPNEGGRGPSTWDSKLGDEPAVQSYYKYEDDLNCLKSMKADSYRFSVSWSRLLPNGKLSGGVNQESIQFYNNFINKLVENGIVPFATLFHFDLPQALEDEYNGVENSNFVDDFTAYAELCFKTFGDRVKHWVTINEAQVYATTGYRTSNLTTYPYQAGRNIILAHANAAKVYREKYQADQQGVIGMASNVMWFLPYDKNNSADVQAAKRAWDFYAGWFLDPLVKGDYPSTMKEYAAGRLPAFTDDETELVKGSIDFIGVNYYTSRYTQHYDTSNDENPYLRDQMLVARTENKDGVSIGPEAEGPNQIYVYPEGLGQILLHLKDEYNDPIIYIIENGYPKLRDDSKEIAEALQDDDRISFIESHLYQVRDALREGANIKGYSVWALIDCMEPGSFYTMRFGLNYIDYNNDYERIPKKSASWYRSLITGEEKASS